MNARTLYLLALLPCLQGCVFTFTPEDSAPVPLSAALQIVAHDLNDATPVVLSDIETPAGVTAFNAAINARQCAIDSSDPPLPVITGPVSLALQGTIQGQVQGTGTAGFPATFTGSFQVQRTKGQQLTVSITFVPASGLGSFFWART